MRTKESKNKYMRNYFNLNPLVNALNCHNLERRNKNYSNISMKEYLKYRKYFGVDKLGRIKTNGKISNIEIWESLR
jgi:hypothetical protein